MMISRTIVDYDIEMLREAFEEVAQSGQFVNGPRAKRFEDAVCEYIGVNHCIGVNSGTSALLLAYKVLGAEKILTTPFTFSATAMAGLFQGMEVVFCDIEEETYCMDMDDVERKLQEHGDIDVVVPVHIFGAGTDMDRLGELKEKYGFKVVSDSAQAFGTRINGHFAGGHPSIDLSCFSLYPTKNLSCAGDGGFITTNDEKLHEKVIRYRDNGRFPNGGVLGSGGNFRLSEFQATVAYNLLLKFNEHQDNRQKIADYYFDNLKTLQEKGILKLPKRTSDRTHTYHLFCLEMLKDNPKDVIPLLRDLGIGATLAYGYLISDYDMLEMGEPYSLEDFPKAREITNKLLAIPMSQYMTLEQAEQTVKAIKEVVGC